MMIGNDADTDTEPKLRVDEILSTIFSSNVQKTNCCIGGMIKIISSKRLYDDDDADINDENICTM